MSNPLGKDGRNERHIMRKNAQSCQMELSLRTREPRAGALRRSRAPKTAQWWFSHMRRVVAEAAEWTAPTAARQEQEGFVLGESKEQAPA